MKITTSRNARGGRYAGKFPITRHTRQGPVKIGKSRHWRMGKDEFCKTLGEKAEDCCL